MNALEDRLERLYQQVSDFEATESVANTGTGSRREGEGFERLFGELWESVRALAATEGGAKCSFVSAGGNRRWAHLALGDRSVYLPNNVHAPSDELAHPPAWLQLAFNVTELVQAFPTEAEAIQRYSPDHGSFAGDRYPQLYSGLSTKFDDTIVLCEAGVLKEKILLEYKTAKSSKGRQIDGNAHERLSFQIMQYLEVATRYPRCSMAVFSNGAFVKYRNKYHVNFHVQADRLANFAWFKMEHACTPKEYRAFVKGILNWLLTGTRTDSNG